jgi:hypothetical protein
MRRAELTDTVTQLETLQRAFTASRAHLRFKITTAQEQIARGTEDLRQLEQVRGQVVSTQGAAFALTTPQGSVISSRSEAGTYLHGSATGAMKAARHQARPKAVPLGSLAGVCLVLAPGIGIRLQLAGSRLLQLDFTQEEWGKQGRVGLVRRLEHLAASIPTEAEHLAERITKTREDLTAAKAEHDAASFDAADRLAAAQAELAQIDAALALGNEDLEAPADGREPPRAVAVYPTQANGALPYRVQGRHLMVGDIVQEEDDLDVFWEAVSPAASMEEAGLLKAVGESPREPLRPGEYREFVLVSRLLDNLTDLQRLAMEDGNVGIAAGRWIPAGARVSVISPDGGLHTGVLAARSGGWNESWEFETPQGKVTIPAATDVDPASHLRAVLHGGFTAQDRARGIHSLALSLPGDEVTHTSDHGVLPVGSVLVGDGPGSRRWVTPDGVAPPEEQLVRVRVATKIGSSPLSGLHADQLGIGGGPKGTVRVELKNLRPGDLAPAADIDPKAGIDGHVRIARVPSYGTVGDIDYQVPSDPARSTHTVRRRLHVVTDAVRHYATLTESESRLLAPPGTTDAQVNPTAASPLPACDRLNQVCVDVAAAGL